MVVSAPPWLSVTSHCWPQCPTKTTELLGHPLMFVSLICRIWPLFQDPHHPPSMHPSSVQGHCLSGHLFSPEPRTSVSQPKLSICTSSWHNQPPSCSVSWLFINWTIEDRTHHPKFTTSPSWLKLRSSKVKFQTFATPHASDYLPNIVSYFFAYDHDAKWYIWPSPGHSVTGADASTELSGM